MITRRTLAVSTFAGVLAAVAAPRTFATGTPGTFEITKTPQEWKAVLSEQQYYVLRDHGTERPGSSPLDKNYAAGMYHCAGCDLPLYASDTKFDSGTGWPSFWQAIDNAVGTTVDKSFFMTRTEVHCRRCGGHLGHIFDDGPKPTGMRHCINGVALKFIPKVAS